VGQYGEDAAVAVLGFGQRHLGEDMADMCLHGAFADVQALRDPAIGQPPAINAGPASR
jgi:hypothetical protein